MGGRRPSALLVLLFLTIHHTWGQSISKVDGNVKQFRLNDGNEIPAVALGTSLGHLADGTRILPVNHSLARAVQWALEAGYRHIDTASLYRVEDEVGLGVREYVRDNNEDRRHVYITGKLWNDAHERAEVIPALRKSLEDLQMDYLDLYLIHYPMAYKILVCGSGCVSVSVFVAIGPTTQS